MTLSPARVGIDISKHGLDIHNATTRQTWRTANTADEIERLLKTLPPACVLVFEATAPYDRVLRLHASTSAMTVLRVNPTRARAYAFAAGSLAKTDAVDARVLAQLPATVANGPEPAFDAEREALASLHRRRDQMVETRAVERGRSRDVSDAAERGSLQRHITWLDGEIKALDGELQGMIAKPAFAKTAGLLRSVRGVGAVTAATVLALLPELGQRSAKSIAALVGLAPINRDSGMYRGQMHIGGGRKRVRQALYMAALSAIRAVPRLKLHYEAIKARSGHAKVAIIAIARKLLVILNTIVKTGEPFRPDDPLTI